ncbi:hypothetical protein [Mycoplasma sp. Z1473D]
MKNKFYKLLSMTSSALIPTLFLTISCQPSQQKENNDLETFNKTYGTTLISKDIKNNQVIDFKKLVEISKKLNLKNTKDQEFFKDWLKPAVLRIIDFSKTNYNKQVIDSYTNHLGLLVETFITPKEQLGFTVQSLDIKPEVSTKEITSQHSIINEAQTNRDKQIKLISDSNNEFLINEYWNIMSKGFSNNSYLALLKNSKVVVKNNEISLWDYLLTQNSVINKELQFNKFTDWFTSFKDLNHKEKNLLINKLGSNAVNTLGDSPIISSNILTKEMKIDNNTKKLSISAEVFCYMSESMLNKATPLVQIIKDSSTNTSTISIVLASTHHNSYPNISTFELNWYKNNLLWDDELSPSDVTELPGFYVGNPDKNFKDLNDAYKSYKEYVKPKFYKLNIDFSIPVSDENINSVVLAYAQAIKLNDHNILIDQSKPLELSKLASYLSNNNDGENIQLNDDLFNIFSFKDNEINKLKESYLKNNK